MSSNKKMLFGNMTKELNARYESMAKITGLKKSNAWSSIFCKYQPTPERFDHTTTWRDINGKVIVITEPYISEENFNRDFFRDWMKRGFDFVEADYGIGLWNPPHCRLFLLTPKKDPANLGNLLSIFNALEKCA